jgi:hypothetical protein
MITFFTTCKNFTGLFGVIQTNALKCWHSLGIPIEVIVFGNSQGLEELKKVLPIVHVPEINAFEGRVPYINAMFQKANEIAKYDILCFLNADILLTGEFVKIISEIHKKLKSNYLIVGQRINIDVDFLINFEKDFENELKLLANKGSIHHSNGSDLFVFAKGQYPLGSIPDLLVGRSGWDLWMIFNSRQKRYKTIDLSNHYLIYHQNHDYSHKVANVKLREEEDQRNYLFIKDPRARYIFQLNTCDYEVDEGAVKKKNPFENLSATIFHHELLFGKRNLKYIWLRFIHLFFS